MSSGWGFHIKSDDVVEAQWRQLPNYVEDGTNAIVVADLSGSMMCDQGRPMASSIGLAIYFAERNHGDYHNMFIPFSSDSSIVELHGETLEQKISCVMQNGGYCGSTNLESAFQKILDVAVKNNIKDEDMVGIIDRRV